VGQFRGGPAIVTALVCAFFTSFTGASGVTILALWGVLLPVFWRQNIGTSGPGFIDGSRFAGHVISSMPPADPLRDVANHSATGRHHKPNVPRRIGPGVSGYTHAWWGIRQGPKASDGPHAFYMG